MNRVSIKEVPFKVKFLMGMFIVCFCFLFLTPSINKKEINENLIKANSYYVLTDYFSKGKFNASSIKSKEVLYVYQEDKNILKLYVDEGENSACFLFDLKDGERKDCNF